MDDGSPTGGGFVMSAVQPTQGGRRSGTAKLAGCPSCGAGLVLHQPDLDLANRLLGTCEECKAWFVVDGQLRLVSEVSVPQRATPRRRGGRTA